MNHTRSHILSLQLLSHKAKQRSQHLHHVMCKLPNAGPSADSPPCRAPQTRGPIASLSQPGLGEHWVKGTRESKPLRSQGRAELLETRQGFSLYNLPTEILRLELGLRLVGFKLELGLRIVGLKLGLGLRLIGLSLGLKLQLGLRLVRLKLGLN